MPVYQRIADLCRYEGSQRKFAEKAGLKSAAVSNIIRNKQGIRSETTASILKAYPKLNPMWLLLDEGDMWMDEEMQKSMAIEEDLKGEEKDGAIYDRLNELLERRVAELEREIKRNNPDLADELGIE